MKELQSILKNCEIDRVKVDAAAGQTDVTSDSVDMANWEGVIFIAMLGPVDATGVPSIKVAQSTDDSSFADLEGSKVSGTASDDDKCLVVEVYRPRERYVRCVVGRATADATVDGIMAIKYGAKKLPITQNADVIGGGELHVSPAEGTA